MNSSGGCQLLFNKYVEDRNSNPGYIIIHMLSDVLQSNYVAGKSYPSPGNCTRAICVTDDIIYYEDGTWIDLSS